MLNPKAGEPGISQRVILRVNRDESIRIAVKTCGNEYVYIYNIYICISVYEISMVPRFFQQDMFVVKDIFSGLPQ